MSPTVATTRTLPPQTVQTQHGPLTQQAAIAALSVVLLSGLTAEQMSNVAEALLVPFGFSALAIGQVVNLTIGHVPDLQSAAAAGSAAEQMAKIAAPNHALYLFNAAKRLSADPTSLASERRYFTQHLAAARGRREAATKADAAVLRFGAVLGWHTQEDELVDPECRQLAGTNFTLADPPHVHGRPVIPGTVHPSCRCFAGAAHVGARVAEPIRVATGVA